MLRYTPIRRFRILFVLLTSLGAAPLLAQPSLSFVPDTLETCQPGQPVALSPVLLGFAPPLTFDWTPGIWLSDSTIQNPLAAPFASITYTLRISDINGDTASASVHIAVSAQPVAAFTLPASFCVEDGPFPFAYAGSPAPDSVRWLWGPDATPATSTLLQPPAVSFATPGLKSASLWVYDACGFDSVIVTFEVRQLETFIVTSQPACAGTPLSFSDSTITDSLIAWAWDFGDGNTSTQPMPQHTYAQPGTYLVSLLASNALGCTDTALLPLVVGSVPVAAFSDSLGADCRAVFFTNQTDPASYLWDFGDSSLSTLADPVHVYADTGYWVVSLTASHVCGSDQTSQTRYIGELCFWPGDADDNLVADNLDVLALGLAYGATGPLRPDASLTWERQGAPAWHDSLPGGPDFAYCDTNGDGIVDAADTLAIYQHYGFTHNKRGQLAGTGFSLFFDTTGVGGPVLTGSLLSLPLVLEASAAGQDSAYGLAFTIHYDTDLIDSASARLVVLPQSWLGDSLLHMRRDFADAGQMPVAITRTDQRNAAGTGQIAVFTFVMIDDIARMSGQDTLRLDFSDVVLITAQGQEVPVQAFPAAIAVVEPRSDAIAPTWAAALRLYPQPADDRVALRGIPAGDWQLRLCDWQGRTCATQQGSTPDASLSLQDLPTGIYWLELQCTRGRWCSLVQHR
ncbi:MAG: hypothetical protein OHK0039_19910 [Bacteroidia bacterium]